MQKFHKTFWLWRRYILKMIHFHILMQFLVYFLGNHKKSVEKKVIKWLLAERYFRIFARSQSVKKNHENHSSAIFDLELLWIFQIILTYLLAVSSPCSNLSGLECSLLCHWSDGISLFRSVISQTDIQMFLA